MIIKKSLKIFGILLLLTFCFMVWYLISGKTQKIYETKSSHNKIPRIEKSEKKVKPPPKKEEKILLPQTDNQELDDFLNSQKFSGTALVVRKGKVIFNQYFGLADQNKQISNKGTTKYFIGSAQKSIIATAILQLEQAGKLKIEDPISLYIKDFPNGHKITLKNLLNHTSGLTGRSEGNQKILPEQIIQEIERAGSDYPIGTWHYTDSNYAILAYIIQLVTRQSIQEYIKEHIFKPANMYNTGFSSSPEADNNLAESYKEKDGYLDKIELPDLSQLFGAGDIYTTATDFYSYDQALMQGKLIDDREKTKMFTSGSQSTYGMGFYVNPGSYSSHGVLGGFNTINTFTKTGLTYIILLTNTNQVQSLGKTADHIYELLNNGLMSDN